MTEETERTREEWKNIIDQAGSSGKPIHEWCKENNIKTRRFYYWRRKLKEAEEGSPFYEVPDDEQPEEMPRSRDLVLKYRQFSLVIPEEVNTAVLEKVITVLGNA